VAFFHSRGVQKHTDGGEKEKKKKRKRGRGHAGEYI